MARSDISVRCAADRVEYAETAAKYRYLNLHIGKIRDGIIPAKVRAMCDSLDVKPSRTHRNVPEESPATV